MPSPSRKTALLTTAVLLAATSLSLLAAAPTAAPAPAAPPKLDDGKGAFATGKYRNLFAEMGHSEADIKAKVDKAFNTLFHGDLQTQALFIPAGKNDNGPLA